MRRVKTGVIGCGRISGQYLENLVRRFPFCIEVTACGDLVEEAARVRAAEFAVARVCGIEEMLADPDIEIIVNLTNPVAHYDLNRRALLSGKHVYGEKPFTITRDEGRTLLEEAARVDRRIGGAPDTFLGAGLQTCRSVIDSGWIGVPVSANAFLAMGSPGPHYSEVYRGPVFDMGPYYLTALVALLGPVQRVAGIAQTPFPEKRHDDPQSDEFGGSYRVPSPTSVCGVLEFESGVSSTFAVTSELFGYSPRLEIYGTEGTLICNDPNNFGGPVFLQPKQGEKRELPLVYGYRDSNRGLGVADMALAIQADRPHRASGELCFHVLDIAHALHESSQSGRYVTLESRVDRPAPVEPGISALTLASTGVNTMR